jgi:uncharacterized protein YfaS (alpha-2-macroglobulin family)
MHFLIEARDRGRAVPADMLTNGNNWLKSLAASEGTSLADERARAYAIYVLTRQGIVTSNFAAALQKRLENGYATTYAQDIAAAYLAASYQLMKQQGLANRLIGGLQFGSGASNNTYDDPMARDAALLFLLAQHFPERLAKFKADALDSLVKAIAGRNYNTYSSAQTILALQAYARVAEKLPPASFSAVEVLRGGGTRALTLPPVLMPRAAFSSSADRIRFTNKSTLNAYWVVEQSGFDRRLPDKPEQEIKNGLEVLREYTDTSGRLLTSIKIGDEIQVRLKFRAIGRPSIDNVALVDLLPGGFDVVDKPRPPRWQPDAVDIRDDRVVLYGTVRNDFQEFVYAIKATNAGTFAVPPAYGEGMYEPAVRARSLGSKITVEGR